MAESGHKWFTWAKLTATDPKRTLEILTEPTIYLKILYSINCLRVRVGATGILSRGATVDKYVGRSMKYFKNLTILVSMLISSSTLAVENLNYVRGEQSKIVEQFVSLLRSNNPVKVASSLAYPSTFSKNELAKDRSVVANVYNTLSDIFGQFELLGATPGDVKYYEVGTTGGSLFWWASDKNVVTKKYMYAARFSKYGKGYIQIYSSNLNGVEKVVGFYYCLPAENPDSRERALMAMHSLLDVQGVPRNHPVRKKVSENVPVIDGH